MCVALRFTVVVPVPAKAVSDGTGQRDLRKGSGFPTLFNSKKNESLLENSEKLRLCPIGEGIPLSDG